MSCEDIQFELSVAHDEGRPPAAEAVEHLATCSACLQFARGLLDLDRLLARGDVSLVPPMAPPARKPMAPPARKPVRRWDVAAAIAAGIGVGAMMAGPAGIGAVQAQDLFGRLQVANSQVDALSANVLVYESGWHPRVPERSYAGILEYAAPESLRIELRDLTSPPDDAWLPNDVSLEIDEGILVATAVPPCPATALPGCLTPPATTAFSGLEPFAPGVVSPLEILGPGRALWGGLEVTGTSRLRDRTTVQIRTTVSGAELLAAITAYGSWRELHPSDEVLMWLDWETLLPLRLEVFAAPSAQRQRWAMRHGYSDSPTSPLLIVDLEPTSERRPEIELATPAQARTGGFHDASSTFFTPALPDGFVEHRHGYWVLPEGDQVDVASWSDGRAWLKVESTGAWTEERLLGTSTPFVTRIELAQNSFAYLDQSAGAVAIHGDSVEAVVSGTVDSRTLIEVAGSLGIVGRPVPSSWPEAAVLPLDQLPPGTLVPQADWWTGAGLTESGSTTIRLQGGGSRAVIISQEPGGTLRPPSGPDTTAVPLRGTVARFDEAGATLAWIENGVLIQMRSETVGLSELIALAESMRPN